MSIVDEIVESGELHTRRVIDAFRTVNRSDFIPKEFRKFADSNEPLPTMAGQTISQPLTVAIMTELLEAGVGQKILEIGSGSGYQAAILSVLVGKEGKVITTEIIPELFEFAKNNLKNYKNVVVVHSDGSTGYQKEAPYDRIIVTADAPSIPDALLRDLKDGGKMVIPVGSEMFVVEKENGRIKKTFTGYFSFVPLRGAHGHQFL